MQNPEPDAKSNSNLLFPQLEKFLESSGQRKVGGPKIQKKKYHDEVVLQLDPIVGMHRIHSVDKEGKINHVEFTPQSWDSLVKDKNVVSLFTHGDVCELPIETVNRARVKAGLEPIGATKSSEV